MSDRRRVLVVRGLRYVVKSEKTMGLALRAPARRTADVAVAIPVDSARWTVDAAILRVLRDHEGIGLEEVVEVVTEEALDGDASWDWRRPDNPDDESACRREAISALRRMFGTVTEPVSIDDELALVPRVATR